MDYKKDYERFRDNTQNAIADAVDAIDGEPADQKLAIQKLIWAVAWLGDRVMGLEDELYQSSVKGEK